jgi:type I restriction enzyme S subunit
VAGGEEEEAMSKSLPPGWRRVRLGDVLEQVNRFEKLDPGREYRLLGVKWYAQGVFEREPKFGKAIAAKQLNRVEEGDFVYNRLFAWKGSFAVVGNGHAGGYVSGEFPVFRAKPDAILAEFLYRHFSRPQAWRLIEHHSTGTTNVSRNRWREEQFLSWHISLPPINEQERIIATLRGADDAIEANAEVIARTLALKKSLANELLRSGIPRHHTRFKDSPVGRIPEDWEVRTLGECGTWRSGGTPFKANPAFWNGTIPWASAKDMKTAYLWDTQDHVTTDGVLAGARVIPGDSLLVVVRGMILAHTFPVAITKRPMAFNQDLKALQCGQGTDPEFLMFALQHHGPALLLHCTAATHGTRRLPQTALESTLVGLPPLQEQRQIADVLSQTTNCSEVSLKAVARLRGLRARLIASLLAGPPQEER